MHTEQNLTKRETSPVKAYTYAVSSCYRTIFNVKSNENVRHCMNMFKCDDVDTQKIVGGLLRMDNLLRELVAVLSN